MDTEAIAAIIRTAQGDEYDVAQEIIDYLESEGYDV